MAFEGGVKMSVLIYEGGLGTVRKSGVGQAILHQGGSA